MDIEEEEEEPIRFFPKKKKPPKKKKSGKSFSKFIKEQEEILKKMRDID